MHKPNAIITFVRKPELGKVKTRLAATIGNEKALKVYELLLQHTHKVVDQIAADKFIFYTDIVEDDIWNGYFKLKQANGDLGIKMMHAFETVFKLGYGNVAIIGSDCLELAAEHIQNAFTVLETNDAVIGPCFDGGYYLLGLKTIIPLIFENKLWSTSLVYQQTIDDLVNYNYQNLATLNDIDDEQDLKKHPHIYTLL